MGFQVGEQIGDYAIVGAVGSGGAGQVFKVEHRITGRVEAMKVLLQGRLQSAAPGERFQREIKLQASLNHPNIASVHNAFWVRDELVMVMELIEGASLDRIIEADALTAKQAVRIGRQALHALEYAHQRGITHRDIKPENIMLNREHVAKLMDFGLAKDTHDARLTQTGAVVGSLFYISPEQAQGLEEVDHRSDIYSLGAVLYEAVTGQKPFPRENSFELLKAAVQETPEPPIKLAPEIPVSLSNAILKAMAKKPADRFQSAHEFGEALDAIALDPNSASAHIELPLTAAPLEVRRRKIRLRAIALGLGLFTCAIWAMRSLSETPLANEVRSYQQEAGVLAEAAGLAAPGRYDRVRTVSFGKPIAAMELSLDGSRVTIASAGGTLERVQFDDGATESIPIAGATARTLALSPAADTIAFAGAGSTGFLWNLAAGKPIRRLAHAAPLTRLAFSDDGRRLASASEDGSIRVWDVAAPSDNYAVPGPNGGVHALAFSPGGALLAAPGRGGLRLWSFDGEVRGESLSGALPAVSFLAFSANGLQLAAAHGSSLEIWDMPSRHLEWSGELDAPILAAVRGPAGPWLALTQAQDPDGRPVLWDAVEGRRLAELNIEGKLQSASFTPAADRLAVISAQGDLTLWRSAQ